ncbi:hypothetical protein ACJX0J_015760 [Zea mays]
MPYYQPSGIGSSWFLYNGIGASLNFLPFSLILYYLSIIMQSFKLTHVCPYDVLFHVSTLSLLILSRLLLSFPSLYALKQLDLVIIILYERIIFISFLYNWVPCFQNIIIIWASIHYSWTATTWIKIASEKEMNGRVRASMDNGAWNNSWEEGPKSVVFPSPISTLAILLNGQRVTVSTHSFFNFLDKGEALSNICKDLHFLVCDIDGTAKGQQQEQKEKEDFFESGNHQMGGLGTLIWTLTIQGI